MLSIDKTFIIKLLSDAEHNSRRRQNYDLRNSDSDTSQRMLNSLIPDTKIPIHRHMSTSETFILIKGHVSEVFYDDEGNETERIELNPDIEMYGVQIPAGVWHTLIVHEASIIMEVKDGAYAPIGTKDILCVDIEKQ